MLKISTLFLLLFCIYCNQPYLVTKLVGQVIYQENMKRCSRMACKCCNECYVPIEIISVKDTIELWVLRKPNANSVGSRTRYSLSGEYDADIEQLVCNFNECDSVACLPLLIGREYQFNGNWRTVHNGKKVFVIESLPVTTVISDSHNKEGGK